MLLLLHIVIALSSILITGLAYILPTHTKLKASYLLVAGTFITGTALVVMSPSHLMSACFSGLIYLGIVSLGILFARRKLQHVSAE